MTGENRRKKNAVFIMVLCMAGMFLCGFSNGTTTAPATEFWENFFANLPFSGFFASVAQGSFEKILGFSIDMPSVTVNSQLLDLTKAVASTVLKVAVFVLFSKLFLVTEKLMSKKQLAEYKGLDSILQPDITRDAGGNILNVSNTMKNMAKTDYLLDFMKSGKYMIVKGIASIIAMVIGIVGMELLMMPLNSFVNHLAQMTHGTILYILLIFAVFAVFATIYSFLVKTSWSVASLKLAVVLLLPEMLSVLVTNTIAFSVYTAIRSEN